MSAGRSIAIGRFGKRHALPPRRFPAPWTVEELDACFVVIDDAGQKLAYYYEEEPGRRAVTKLMTRDEARRIAVNLARLPELLIQCLADAEAGDAQSA